MTAADFSAIQQALSGQYKFERLLGQGGMGQVYLARDEMLERYVAIKVLPTAESEDGEQLERFLREARTAAQLSHPNVVPIYFADEVAGQAFFVMAYIEGESLADRLAARGTLPVADVVRYVREVSWALAYAHARGVVHRDVKPENIMLDRATGRAIVTDFGIAHSPQHTRLTLDGHVVGTVHYMSPEQVTGQVLDGRSDLYALGVVAYSALSGRLPFGGDSTTAILVAHVNATAPPLQRVAPHVPAALAAVVDRCLAKTPADRYESGEALAEALGAAFTASELEASRAPAGPERAVSENEALVIWRRAAQLQAEAAQRLEQRARQQAATSLHVATPGGGYRVRDVEAAAVEAGISQHFVTLALAERPIDGSPIVPRGELARWQERAARRWFGSSEQSLSVSRLIRGNPRRVLAAMGRALHAPPCSLTLQRHTGPHPLDGGLLVFDIPPMATGARYAWLYTRYGLYASQATLSLRPVPNDPGVADVTVYLDLRRGVRVNLVGGGSMTGAMAGLGGLGTALLGAKALALAGVMLALPAAGAAAITTGLCVVGFGAAYRHALRKTRQELEAALTAIENDIRTEELFGAPSTRPVTGPAAASADVSWIGGAAS